MEYHDKGNPINPGSTLTVDSTGPYYAGDTVTLHVSTLPGVELASYTDSAHSGTYPRITYQAKEENAAGELLRYIDAATSDGSTFTFTVPDDIDPHAPIIHILAYFQDISYPVRLPEEQDAKVGGNVSFDPASDLLVSCADGEGQTRTVPVTLKQTDSNGLRVTYTCEFTIPLTTFWTARSPWTGSTASRAIPSRSPAWRIPPRIPMTGSTARSRRPRTAETWPSRSLSC